MEKINESRNDRLETKRKKRNWVLRISLLLIACLVAGGGLYFWQLYNKFDKTFHQLGRGDKSDLRETAIANDDPRAFLIMGIDKRSDEEDVGRPDVLMVATVNPKDKSIKILSIPRDTLTYIPTFDVEDKINHSYSLAESEEEGTGIESTVKTVERLLNIPIDNYVDVNFHGFVDIVDTLGGVDVNVPRDFRSKAFDGEPWRYFKKGPAHLDGEDALAYVRMRKEFGDDLGRNERQREVLTKLITKGKDFSNVTKIDDLVDALGQNVKMNVSANQLLEFQGLISGISGKDIETLTLKGEDLNDGVYYYVLNDGEAERVGNLLRKHLELPPIIHTTTGDQNGAEATEGTGSGDLEAEPADTEAQTEAGQ